MATDEEPIIGSSEAAEILGWNVRKVQRAANTGQIPIVGNLGPKRGYLFKKAAVEELAHEQESSHPAG